MLKGIYRTYFSASTQRQLMEYGSRIAVGNTADIYALDDHRVVKLFAPGTTRETVEREVENTQIAATVTPTPDVHGLVIRDGRYGIILSRVEGPTALSVLRARSWRVVGLALRFARLHALLHEQAAPSLSLLRDRLVTRIEDGPLHQVARERVLTRLDGLSAVGALCHGDFHPDNVLLTTNGPVVIDWMDATNGHPAADVARTALLVRFSDHSEGWVGHAVDRVIRSIFVRAYLREYRAVTDITAAQIHAWELPVAAARLNEAAATEALRRRVDELLCPL